MTQFSIFLIELKLSLKRWCTDTVIRRWCIGIVLALAALIACYRLIDGRTFQIHRNMPDTEIFDRPFGPVTFHVITYDVEQYGHDAYTLPVSDIFSGNPLPFTLHFPHAVGVPVIKIQYEGSTYFLGIDTTQTENFLLADGNLSSRTEKYYSRYNLLSMDFLSPNQPGDFQFSSSDDESREPVLAGLLGLSWLQKFDNVVIDYQAQQIRFNEPAISEHAVPMEKTAIWEYLFVRFSARGREETGIIDTASSTFVIRRDLGNVSKLPENFFLWRETINDLPEATHGMKAVKDVQVGSMNLGTIKAHDNLYWNYQGATRIKRMADYYSFLGYPLWQNHVIQLDFTDTVFRIK
ncbi:MAG: hypothetical protein MJ178_00345 [Treponemataceae bacterium]|nr:hypothetical protein [Treponemataceae bacterium]